MELTNHRKDHRGNPLVPKLSLCRSNSQRARITINS
jgi:hypothetical protein